MSRLYKGGDSYVKTFTISSATGAAANADSTPAGTIYLNGAADAATVTITNPATGVYKAAATLPGVAGDVVELLVAATVGGVATKATVDAVRLVAFTPTDSVRLGLTALPNAVAAASGGLPTFGTGAGQINPASGKVPATLASADVTGNVAVDLQTIKAQTITCAAGVTVLASVGTAATSTAQTGDAYARLGAAGAGLTALGDTRIANLDAAISTRSTYAGGPVASVTAVVAANLTQVGGVAIPTPAVAGVPKVDLTYANGVAVSSSDGTAQAGGAATITLAAADAAGTNAYVDRVITITGGTGAGQSRVIATYNSTTKVATVHRAWDTNPDATSTYAIDPTAAGGPVTDKTGYSLAATGLDALSVADPGAPASHTTVPRMLVAIYRRFYRKVTKTTTQLKTYANDDSTVNSTQSVSDDGSGNQTQGSAT